MKFKEADLERAFESLGGDPSADAARVLAQLPEPLPPSQPIWPLIIGAALTGAAITALLIWLMLPATAEPVQRGDLTAPKEDAVEKLIPRPPADDANPSDLASAGRPAADAPLADLEIGLGQVTLASDSDTRRLYSGARLAYGKTYETAADSFAAISLDDKVELRIGPGTTLVLMDESSLNLLRGVLWLQNPADHSRLYVFTNEGDIAAEPGSVISLAADEAHLQLATFAGNASFDPLAGDTLRLRSTQYCESTGGMVDDPRDVEQPWYYFRWQVPLLARSDREEEVVGMLSALAMDLADPERQELASEEFRRLGGLSARALALALEGMVDTGETRRRVVFLFCDVADQESQVRLLDLLRSQDGEERVRAALTLERVTGEAMNRDSMFWREAPHSDRDSAVINYRLRLNSR